MNVNVKLSLDDAQRNQLARLLDGKDTKRLVTRKEVNTVVHQLLEGLMMPQRSRAGQAATEEEDFVEWLRQQGANDSFIRGALAVVREFRIRKPARRPDVTKKYIQTTPGSVSGKFRRSQGHSDP